MNSIKQIIVSSVRSSRQSTEAAIGLFTLLIGFSPEIQLVKTPDPKYRHYYSICSRSLQQDRFLFKTVYNILRKNYYKQVFKFYQCRIHYDY